MDEQPAGNIPPSEPARQWRLCLEEVVAAPPARVWAIVSQFCNAHLWRASLNTCQRVEGEENTPGCVRYCAGSTDFPGLQDDHQPESSSLTSTSTSPKVKKNWSKEKLVVFDEAGKMLSYTLLDSNLGLQGYSATLQVSHGESHISSCRLRWTVQLDPVPSTTERELTQLLGGLFQRSIQKLGEAVAIPPASSCIISRGEDS